ncbi:MAG: hypothetical protein FJ118_13280 [Deltaproteobacteria bacterium]|nr:hypothetical protein [Deltaproteobacteria bacterium]
MGARFKQSLMALLALVIGLFVAFLLAEVLLRIFPIQGAYFRIPNKPNDAVGFTRFPGQKASFRTSCYETTHIEFNSAGFRDREWPEPGAPSIAVLGDSFMEALEVPLEVTTADILEKLTGVPVLNTGVSSYGTVAQLFVYKTFLARYRPQAVILFFFTENDVKDNSCVLTRLYGESIMQPCGDISEGSVRWRTTYDEAGPRDTSILRALIKRSCLTCLLSYRLLKYDVVNRARHGELDFLYNSYREKPPEQFRKAWEDGWTITKEAILQLNREVRSHGGKLLIVAVPSSYSVVHDWKKVFQEGTRLDQPPDDFDPLMGEKWLERLGRENNIAALNLAPVFLEYRDRQSLKDPYLWYSCDGHWNPVGHFLVANVVAQALVDRDMLSMPPEKKAALRDKIRKDLAMSPRQVLGLEGYRAIYEKGYYRGASNIPEILAER